MSYTPPVHKRIFHSLRRTVAKHWLSRMNAVQIALTGSQGKTNTTAALKHILSQLGPTIATDINLDTIYNIPITALAVRPNTRYAIFECGVDHPNEMDLHLENVKPHIAIITGISPVHTDTEHFGSFENLIKEKRKLIENLTENDFAVLNYDDVHVRKMGTYTKAQIVWYGTDKKNCNIWAEDPKLSIDGLSFHIFFEEQVATPTTGNPSEKNRDIIYPKKRIPIKTALIGLHHMYTIMAAFAVYQIVTKGENPNRFASLIQSLRPLKGRMSKENGPHKTLILNDSLRANPSSTASGLRSFAQIFYTKGKKYAILGEMGELEKPEEEHRTIGRLISTLPIDYLVGIGPNQKHTIEEAISNGFPQKNTFWAPTMIVAGNHLKKIVKEGDFLYLKGSLLRHMERILYLLEGRAVGCSAVVCPFYHSCSTCQYLVSGYSKQSS